MAPIADEWIRHCRRRARQLLAIRSGSRARAMARIAWDAMVERRNRRMHLGLLRRILSS
jgi:hypothetical protein